MPRLASADRSDAGVRALHPPLSARAAEPVADRPYCDDRGRLRVGAELAPEVADIDVDDVGRGIVFIAPHGAEDLLAGHHLAVVAQQENEQLELGGRQLDWAPVATH